MQIRQNLGGRGILHGHILGLLILVDGQVIAVFHDLRFRDEEGLGGAGVGFFVVALSVGFADTSPKGRGKLGSPLGGAVTAGD